MLKKLIVVLLILAFITSIAFTLTGCGENEEPLLIVYLGDSIAEGIAGVSPVAERETYAYYGVLGIRNEYIYRNRAISGHQTCHMLEYIQREDEDVRMTRTLLTEADIIHISILGNDLLLMDLGQIMLSVINEDYTFLDSIIENSRQNFAEIVETLRSYNPTATIMFQNVYNPVFEDSDLITPEVRQSFADMEIPETEFRTYGKIILDRLNAVISDYLEAHPDTYYIIDSNSEFERIYQEDSQRGQDLIFCDCIHPSNEGHAVLADLIQRKLEELNLADKTTAVKNYKTLRKEQLIRLYTDTVDINAISGDIDAATTCEEITELYFDAIEGLDPHIN